MTWPSTVTTRLETMLRADMINFWAFRHIVLAPNWSSSHIDRSPNTVQCHSHSQWSIMCLAWADILSHVCLTLFTGLGTVGLGALDAPVVIKVAGLVRVGHIDRQTMYIITARIGRSACTNGEWSSSFSLSSLRSSSSDSGAGEW